MRTAWPSSQNLIAPPNPTSSTTSDNVSYVRFWVGFSLGFDALWSNDAFFCDRRPATEHGGQHLACVQSTSRARCAVPAFAHAHLPTRIQRDWANLRLSAHPIANSQYVAILVAHVQRKPRHPTRRANSGEPGLVPGPPGVFRNTRSPQSPVLQGAFQVAAPMEWQPGPNSRPHKSPLRRPYGFRRVEATTKLIGMRRIFSSANVCHPSHPVAFCSVAIAVTAAIGLILRLIALELESPLVSSLASIVLFAPAPAVATWIAWRTQLHPATMAQLAVLTAVAFAAWNGIMLTGAASEHIVPALMSNAMHWALFCLTAVTVGRCLQWLSGFGIWAVDPTRLASGERPAPRLTIRRLLCFTTLIAVLVLAYRTWLSTWIPTADGLQESGSSEMGRAIAMDWAAEPPTWYQWFPRSAKPWISGIMGGCLVGMHWLVVTQILKWRRHRFTGLFAWISVAACLRWLTQSVYWDPQSMVFADQGILQRISDTTFRVAANPAWKPPDGSLIPVASLWIEASVQTGCTLATLWCLRRMGFRLGWQSNSYANSVSAILDTELDFEPADSKQGGGRTAFFTKLERRTVQNSEGRTRPPL